MAEIHRCPYPGCTRSVPRHMFACRSHWYLLPQAHRDAIWQGYRADTGEHLRAMAHALAWYADHAQARCDAGRRP